MEHGRSFLGAPLDLDELWETLKWMPSDRSPRPNRITVEVIKACWSFIGPDVLMMIRCFWESGILAYKLLEGIIKLILKSAFKENISDWRPITLLNLIYKLIAKLLALRLNTLLPDLISEQQSSFVPGRYILDNVSIAWLVKDWLAHSLLSTLFLKLDFEKAFDRVDHEFL